LITGRLTAGGGPVPGPGKRAAKVLCATTTRAFSAGVATKSENAARLAQALLGDREAWAGGRQCHGAEVAIVDDVTDPLPHLFDECDGIATRRRGVVLCCFTADCVPVVIADAAAGVIGIAHAGWRGTRASISLHLVAAMVSLGAREADMSAWIAPAISGAAYEVSEELAAEFASAFPAHAERVVKGRHLDLPLLNALQLAAAGLSADRIATSGLCTFGDPGRFFSYRRDASCGVHLLTGIALAP
jgi:YfiH family protein